MSFSIDNSVNVNYVSTTALDTSTVNTKRIEYQNSVENTSNPSENTPTYDVQAVTTSTPVAPLGQKYVFNEKTYRYCYAASFPGLAFQKGNLCGTDRDNTFLTTTFVSNTSNEYVLQLPSAVTENELVNRTIYNADGDWEANSFIVSNTAGAAGEDITIMVNNYIQDVSQGTPDIKIAHSRYYIKPYTTASDLLPVGINNIDSSGNGYFWVQTSGEAPLKQDSAGGTSALMQPGKAVVAGINSVGRGRIRNNDAADVPLPSLGICIIPPPAVNKIAWINLNLDY